jgi:signal transduction histidine kinase
MRRRLVVGFAVLTALMLSVLIVPLGVTFARQQTDRLTLAVTNDAWVMATAIEETLEGDATVDLGAVAKAYTARTGARVVIVGADGIVRADSQPPAGLAVDRDFSSRPEVAAALAGHVSTGTRRSATLGAGLVFVAVPVASGQTIRGAVRITYPTTELDHRVRRQWLVLAGISTLSLGLTVAAGLFVSRWVARPVQRLRDGAVAAGQGDLAARIPVDDGPPELREVAHAFNVMVARLGDVFEAQRSFVGDASHQLRTPITAIRLRLDNLESRLGEDPERDRSDLAHVRGEVERLTHDLDGLLALARLESADTAPEPIVVASLLADRAETWRALAEEQGVSLVVGTAPGVVRGVRARVGQALDNLLANALDASPPGSTVTLGSNLAPHHTVAIHVRDQGHGLTPAQRDLAFDRFHTTKSPDGDALGGTGLGLPVARRLVRADGGDLTLADASGGGVDAVVSLPGV